MRNSQIYVIIMKRKCRETNIWKSNTHTHTHLSRSHKGCGEFSSPTLNYYRSQIHLWLTSPPLSNPTDVTDDSTTPYDDRGQQWIGTERLLTTEDKWPISWVLNPRVTDPPWCVHKIMQHDNHLEVITKLDQITINPRRSHRFCTVLLIAKTTSDYVKPVSLSCDTTTSITYSHQIP